MSQGRRMGNATVWLVALAVLLGVWGAAATGFAQEAANSNEPSRQMQMQVQDLFYDDEGMLIAELVLANVGSETVQDIEVAMIVLNECEIEGENPERDMQSCHFVTYNEFTASSLNMEPGAATSGTFNFGPVPEVELEDWFVRWYIKFRD